MNLIGLVIVAVTIGALPVAVAVYVLSNVKRTAQIGIVRGLARVFRRIAFVCTRVLLAASLLFFALAYATRSFDPSATWPYRVLSNKSVQDVIIEPRPHDCDFEGAPFGRKYCHYEKHVEEKQDTNGSYTVYVYWERFQE